MFSKIEVNGDGACDLYRYLKAGNPGGDGNEAIVWNFSKFLIGKEGEVLQRFDPTVSPEDVGNKLAEIL
jgi:glutathione peroxidase